MISLNLSDRSQASAPPSTLPVRKMFHWQPDGSLLFRVDWSSIESLLSCNRSAEYKLVHSRQSGSRAALTFGAAIHAGLEIWYRNKHLEDQSTLLSRCYSAIESTFAESPPSHFSTDYRTSDYAIQSFHSYITHYKDEILTPFTYQDKPLVEFSFSFPLGKSELPIGIFGAWGLGTLTNDVTQEKNNIARGTLSIPVHIEWSGIVDMLAEVNGSLYVVDHKTTSILSQDFFDGFEIAMQPVGYFSAVRAAFPDLPIKGFLANVLACRKPVAAVTKSGRPTTSKPFEALRRQYNYSDWHVEEFKRDALALIEELFANLTNNYFPRKTTWCVGKYGKCPFFDVCALPPEQRMSMLQSDNYTNNTWRPV
jgi:PD-(D/E)XK nuclease superfamily